MKPIIINMNNEQLNQFQTNKQLFTWLTLNNYTDDLKDETEINANNITAIVYQSIHK
jgi:hypothetical protein